MAKQRITNVKLNINIIDKLNKTNATATEIDLILHLSLIQNSLGMAEVYYLDVIDVLEITKQTFYNTIQSLSNKGIIEADTDGYGYYSIMIDDNMYLNEKDDTKQYLNVNKHILMTSAFRKLKAKEKILVLKLLLNKQLKSKKTFKIYISTLKKWLNITNSRTILKYLNNVKQFFNFEIIRTNRLTENLIRFSNANHRTQLRSSRTELELFYSNKLKLLCKKTKIQYDAGSLYDTVNLIRTYSYKLPLSKVHTILFNSLVGRAELQPRLFNTLLRANLI